MPGAPAPDPAALGLVIDPGSGVAPFEQVRAQVAARAASGDLPAGTRLPTVRGLAEWLDLAPNTVAKAFRQLESDGVVTTEGRRGTFVSASARAGSTEALAAAAEYAAQGRRLGLTLAEAERLLHQAW